MKKKWLVFSIVISLTVFFCFFINIKEKEKQNRHAKRDGPYFQLSKITRFSQRLIPFVNIEIEGEQIEAQIDLGSNGTICLEKTLLDNIKGKKTLHVKTSHGVRGRKYYNNHFELAEIKLGKATLSRPRGNEMNPDFEKDAKINPIEDEILTPCLARIGWTFFNPLNLYLDCTTSTIGICDSVETLKKNGYLLDCVEMPLMSIGNAIGFEAMTNAGPLKCLLDTGSSHNIIHSDEERSIDDAFKNPRNRISFSFFKIGSYDFGEIRFVRAPLKMREKIDAIVGMEFIYSKQIFIDFSKRKIYFSVPGEKK